MKTNTNRKQEMAIRSEEMLKGLRKLTVEEIAQELNELKGLKKEWAEKVEKLKEMLGTRFDKLIRELYDDIGAEVRRVEKNAYLKG